MADSVIEYINCVTDRQIATVQSSMVPLDGSYISIRKKTWLVVGITYALDDADTASMRRMRANVYLDED